MPKVQTVTLELQRPGPPHNQLLSPLTPYLAMCSSRAANTVYLDFEQQDFLLQLQGLDYGMAPQYQQAQLGQTGTTMGRLLSSIRSLATTIAEATDPGPDRTGLIHLRLISDAAELAMLPFEAAISAPGFPGEGQPLLLQSDAPICLTRESRKPEYRELDYFHRDQKILFAFAELPGSRVPARAHLLALRRALDPWCNQVGLAERLQWVRERITVLPNATLESIREACSNERYCYVHILAHGTPRQKGVSREQEYGLALHDSRDSSKPDFVDGTRLAEALCGYDTRSQNWWNPKVVTLAACDSGNQGALIVPGGSLAHTIHQSGVPLVVASQFPLTFSGSVLLTEVLYLGLLWGEDPFVLLHEVRRRLYIDRRDSLDWASLVAYSNWPASLEANHLTFQFNQAVRALEAIDRRLRVRFGKDQNSNSPDSNTERLLERDLARVKEFRIRMQHIVPILIERVTTYVQDIDQEAANLAEHNIDRSATQLQTQALVRQSDLEYRQGIPTWRQPLKEAYRLICELRTRSQARGLALQYKELLQLIRLTVFLTKTVPKEAAQEAIEGLQAAIEESHKAPSPMLSSPPELWLHAALAEVFVLMADDDPNIQSKLTSEVKEMCRLVGQSDPDDVNQVQYRYERMIGWWAKNLSPAVVTAAHTTVDALRAAVKAKIDPQSQSPSVADSEPIIEPKPVPPKRPEPPEPELKIDGRDDLLHIIGEDDRKPISNAAEVFPACCLCIIQKTVDGNKYPPGTGWLVGPQLIITAAHVVHLSGRQTESVSIWFARNGNVSDGQVVPLSAKETVKLPEGRESATPEVYDYAVIVLPPEHRRSLSRYFSVKALSRTEVCNTPLHLTGYPNDPPEKYPGAKGQPTEQTIEKAVSCDENKIRYCLDTDEGQSGSPVWVNTAEHPYTVVGIHVGSLINNEAIRITQQIEKFIGEYLG